MLFFATKVNSTVITRHHLSQKNFKQKEVNVKKSMVAFGILRVNESLENILNTGKFSIRANEEYKLHFMTHFIENSFTNSISCRCWVLFKSSLYSYFKLMTIYFTVKFWYYISYWVVLNFNYL